MGVITSYSIHYTKLYDNVTGTGATLGAQTTHTATITDDDSVSVAFQAAASATTDETAANHAITVVLSVPAGTTPSAVTVDVTDAGGGSATSGTDYTAVGTVTLTFPAGSANGATQIFNLGVLADTLVEGNETVVITSYSIHYTKLYDASMGWQRPPAPGPIRSVVSSRLMSMPRPMAGPIPSRRYRPRRVNTPNQS